METNDLIGSHNDTNKHLIDIEKELKNLINTQKYMKIILFFLIIMNMILFLVIIKNKKYINEQIKKSITDTFLEVSYKIYKEKNNQNKEELNIETNNLNNNNLNNKIEKNEEINNDILIPYLKKQFDFCDNPDKYFNKEIEEQIKISNVELNGMNYQIYLYKSNDVFSSNIMKDPSFDSGKINNILNGLKSYSKKNNILINKDIYILDIGGNIGYYHTFFSKLGYTVLSFEPFEKNYYLCRKTFCQFNKDSNLVIINKGIGDEERECNYYTKKNSIGNGMVLCNNRIKYKEVQDEYIKITNVTLTKLSNFIPYLSNKHLALIKIDSLGSEGKIIENGIKLINEYNIPYIYLNFYPLLLKEHGNDPKNFLQKFVDIGYKIYLNDFFEKNNYSVNEILNKVKTNSILYLVYE